jgi:transposase
VSEDTIMVAVGIDVAKATLAVVLLRDDGKQRNKSCANTAAGHRELRQWLATHAAGPVPIGLEATGIYHEAVALTLHDAGYPVSVINPSAIAAFAASQLQRAKTDPTDALTIARFVQTQTPPAWTPAPREWRELQALTRRLDALHEMHTQELNRLEATPTEGPVRASIQATLDHLHDQIGDLKAQIHDHLDRHPPLRAQRDLVMSIPGIGEQTAAVVLGELLDIKRFTSARQVAAFSGLVPRITRSGTSVRGRGRLAKLGSSRLRKALYFPALTALRCNPLIQTFAARLGNAGKPKMVVVAAVMRKLMHLIYGVLRSGRTFTVRPA